MLVALAATILIAGIAVLVSYYKIQNTGTIRGLGVEVYWDPLGVSKVTTIDWGTLSPGDFRGTTIYIKNVQNTNCTLSFNTTAWNPVNASKYLLLSWNYTGAVLQPSKYVVVQIRLLVDTAIKDVHSFTFTIWITATEKK
jgi:hypothetical protein